jgi:hypothetical protein
MKRNAGDIICTLPFEAGLIAALAPVHAYVLPFTFP